MATNGNCPGCGRPLGADALEGLCPECLMKAGFGTEAAPTPGKPTARVAFSPPSLEEVAKLFPQLEIVELLGQGGMGAVYKARQPALDRWVALKVLPPHTAARATFSERFNREARALARLTHPNIVAVHDFGQAGGLPYFIMEYVDGVTLRHLVQAKTLMPEQALVIVPQICEALQFAHDEGVVHRDIKPENILLDKKGRVKIADFGIAKILEGETPGRPPITQAEQVIGTPHYMAPEQVEKPHLVDHRADIYSLGVVFYEMLTGELPLGKFQPPSCKVQLDVRLDEVVLRALEKEPERRYQQVSHVGTAVQTIALAGSGTGLSAASAPPTGTVKAQPSSRPFTSHEPRILTHATARMVLVARWTARTLGTLIILLVVPFVLMEGLPPFARQPGGVQLTSAGAFLILLGFVVGWWREGTAAVLIALGWTVVRISEIDFRMTTPFEIVLVVSLLYALVWWTAQARKTVLAGIVAGVLALGLVLGRLFLPTGIQIEGIVRDATTRRPIPKAELTLPRYSRLDDPSAITTTRTSQNGRFTLYVGRYASFKQITVSAAGYTSVQATLGPRALGQRRLIRDFELVPSGKSDTQTKFISDARKGQAQAFAKSHGQNVPMLDFGPVHERVVTEAIDLDKDVLVSPFLSTNHDFALRIAENVRLAEFQGADAYIQGSDLYGLGTTLVLLSETGWDTVIPGELQALLAVAATSTPPLVVMEHRDHAHNAYAVKTREGSTGVLQVVGPTEAPRGVRIRYKLARTNAAAVLDVDQPFNTHAASNSTRSSLPQKKSQ